MSLSECGQQFIDACTLIIDAEADACTHKMNLMQVKLSVYCFHCAIGLLVLAVFYNQQAMKVHRSLPTQMQRKLL